MCPEVLVVRLLQILYQSTGVGQRPEGGGNRSYAGDKKTPRTPPDVQDCNRPTSHRTTLHRPTVVP